MWNERILHAVMRANDGHEGVELLPGLLHLPLMSQTDRVKAIEKLDSFLKYTAPAERADVSAVFGRSNGCSATTVLTTPPIHTTETGLVNRSRYYGNIRHNIRNVKHNEFTINRHS